jgi:glycosyltransferase involved in cell wall biosynthesis
VSPEISVLTTIYNGARHLEATVTSVRTQTFSDFEYLIVDDASDDGRTPQLLERLAAEDERLRIIPMSERRGPFAAANEGLRHATGRYVMRTDADDVSLPTRFATQLDWLREHPAQRACGSYWHLIDDAGRPYSDVRTVPLSPRVFKWSYFLRGGPPHSSLCVERDAFTEIDGYHERPVAQDYRLLLELSRRDWLGIVPEVLVHYRRHPAQIHATSKSLQEIEANLALADHIAEIAPGSFDAEEIAVLKQAGRSRVKTRTATALLDRWRSLWEADLSLTADERADLIAVDRQVRADLVKKNAVKARLLGGAAGVARQLRLGRTR